MSSRVDDVCAQIVESGLHADMLANLAWETLSADSLNDPKAGTRRDFVEAHLATLHNVVRRTQTGGSTLGHSSQRREEDADRSQCTEAVSGA